MSAVATLERAEDARPPFDDRATLEGVVLGAWNGLAVEGRCACPVCGDEMTVGERSVGSCGSCGAELH
jgi:hypothetical protein